MGTLVYLRHRERIVRQDLRVCGGSEYDPASTTPQRKRTRVRDNTSRRRGKGEPATERISTQAAGGTSDRMAWIKERERKSNKHTSSDTPSPGSKPRFDRVNDHPTAKCGCGFRSLHILKLQRALCGSHRRFRPQARRTWVFERWRGLIWIGVLRNSGRRPRCLHTVQAVQRSTVTPLPPSCSPPLPPPTNQSDTVKRHGQSGGGQGGEVRHPMPPQLHISDPTRSIEGEDSVRPTGEDTPTSLRENKKGYVSSQRHRSSSLNIGASDPENVGIREVRTPLCRAIDRGEVYVSSDSGLP